MVVGIAYTPRPWDCGNAHSRAVCQPLGLLEKSERSSKTRILVSKTVPLHLKHA